MYTHFKIGDKVAIKKEYPQIGGRKGIVSKVEQVPTSLIKYDSLTHEGGTGHPQWIYLTNGRGPISGLILEKING